MSGLEITMNRFIDGLGFMITSYTSQHWYLPRYYAAPYGRKSLLEFKAEHREMIKTTMIEF